MPLQKLNFTPGINQDVTSLSDGTGFTDCDKVRFRLGYAEKIGGWEKYSPNTYQGTARDLHDWVALDGSQYLGVGTSNKYYIEEGQTFNDITPVRATTSAGDLTFDTTLGSTTVQVNDSDHGAVLGDFVTISGAIDAGGVVAADLNKEHEITRIVSGNAYEIVVANAATSTQSGGGGSSAIGEYQLSVGLDASVAGTGWGAGVWGGQETAAVTSTLNEGGTLSATDTTITLTSAASFPDNGVVVIESEVIIYTGKSTNDLTGCQRGSYGTTAATHADGTTVTDGSNGWGIPVGVGSENELRLWSHDNFGEDLIINPRDGGIYYWDRTNGVSDRAVNITSLSGADNPPVIAKQVLVSDIDRHVIAFGANTLGTTIQDPLLIRFSDQESATEWNPASDNTSGSLRLGTGSKIMQALETKREILVWTDVSLHSMRFIGPPFTFGIEQIASGITIASPNSAAAAEENVYWMGIDNFYIYNGQTSQLPCTVKDKVFLDFNTEQREKVVGGINSEYNEAIWFYPSAASEENDRYVIYNYKENLWYFGSMVRTAWIDRGVKQFPVAAGSSYLYSHEVGYNDDTSAMSSFVETGSIDLDDGDRFLFLRRIIPDLTFKGSTENSSPQGTITIKARDFPGSGTDDTDSGTISRTVSSPVEEFTDQIHLRVRGRSFKFRFESDASDTRWRLGTPRADIRTDGRR